MPVNAEQNQINNTNTQNTQQNQGPLSLGGGGGQTGQNTGGAGGGRLASYSTGTPSTGQQGSGRFTNLQNYINANQGASNQLQSGIQNTLNQQTGQEQNQANTQASNVRQGIQSGQNQLSTGQRYDTQLNGNNFNAQQFVSDPNQLQNFTNFRTNQAVNTSNTNPQGLGYQLNQAQTTGNQLVGDLQNQYNQLSNETGRQQLLNQTYAKPLSNTGYTTGQKNLDQLFLQTNPNAIYNLQQNAQGNLNNAQNQLNDLNSTQATNLTNLQGGLSNLANQLSTDSTKATNNFYGNLQNQAATDTTNWNNQYNQANQFLNALQGKANTLSPDQFSQMEQQYGLTPGQKLYNVANNDQLSSIANATTPQQATANSIATQNDVNTYGALAQLAGITSPQLTQAGSLVGTLIDPTTGQAKSTVNPLTGSSSLASQLAAAQSQFNQAAGNQNISVNAQGPGFNVYPVSANVGAYLNYLQSNPNANPLDAAGLTKAGVISIPQNSSGYSQGAEKQVVQGLQQWLKDQGYYNTLGSQGAVTTVPGQVTPDKFGAGLAQIPGSGT